MYPSTDIFALGTDETMSFYALQSQKEEEEEPAPKTFGDVREALGCEYLAKMHWVGGQPCVATGKHRYVHTYHVMYILTQTARLAWISYPSTKAHPVLWTTATISQRASACPVHMARKSHVIYSPIHM